MKINVGFSKLKTIFHVSDIHVRLLQRHKEYQVVFEKLYTEIKKQNTGNSIIYVGGDIVHAKLDMSPELIDLTSNFFRRLADIAPTIIITGNHDCNLNNLSRLDALQPIINNLDLPNIHYLKDTGVYYLADVTISVMSVFDEHHPERYHLAKDIEGDTKIALFHGTVDNSTTDFGFRLPSDVKVKIFDGYDLALLGDIHKRQFMNKEHTIAYCGSLIQQNHGETLEHGFLTWDVPSRKATFNKIENDYGYYTLDIIDGVVPEVDDMPRKARLRVRFSGTDSADVKRAIAKVHKLYGVHEMAISRTDTLSLQKEWDRENVISITNIRNTLFQNELIVDYLKRNFAIDDSVLRSIESINKDLNVRLPDEEISRNIHWKLKTFEFDNMFSYGTNNVVDFNKMDGIVGLFGPNHIGKSAVFDALSFCLFDTCSRTFRALDILNNKSNHFWCRTNLEINDQDYYIERRAKKLKNGNVKVNVNFWMIDDSGEKLSLNGDQRRTTNFNIRRIIGTFDDFILTALSLQTNSTVFIDKTQRERKDLLAQFMDINIFDQLYTLANDEIHEVSSLLKSFKKQDYGFELAEVEKSLNGNKIKYDELQSSKDTLIDGQVKLNDRVLFLSKKLKPIDDTIVDIDNLTNLEIEYNSNIDEVDDGSDDIDTEIEANDIILDKTKKVLLSYNEVDIDNQYTKFVQFTENSNKYQRDVDILKREVQFKLDKLKKLEKHKYDPNCLFCINNVFVKDAIKTREELEQDKVLAKDLVDKKKQINVKLKNLKEIPQLKLERDSISLKIEKIENKRTQLNTRKVALLAQRSNFQVQLESIEDKIIRYYDNEEIIKNNKDIENKIVQNKNDLTILNQKISTVNDSLSIIFGKVKVFETKIEQINKTINTVQELELKYEAYEYYMDAIKRDGVPYELISKMIPTIEGEVNNILSQIVDFSIMFELDGKHINTKIIYDENNYWPLELSSGMERFISSIAIRVALINVSNLPRPNLLVIDEGFGTLDADNLNSLSMLFQYLKTQFKFILIISHIEALRDVVDKLVEIKKDGQYSSIIY